MNNYSINNYDIDYHNIVIINMILNKCKNKDDVLDKTFIIKILHSNE